MLSRYKWLTAATSKIHFPPDRKAVQQELSGHIEDLQDHYTTIGLDAEAAEAAALQAMGDPEAIAADLGHIHRPWLGYLWWLSKGLLILAVAVWLIVSVLQIYRNPVGLLLYRLPGWEYYDYLTWEFEKVIGEPEQYEFVPNGAVTTGGYTIRTTQALLRLNGDPARETPWWNLILNFHIDTGWRDEALYWGAETITAIRDSAGNNYTPHSFRPGLTDDNRYCFCASSGSAWGLGQKAALELYDVPLEAEWIELDIGRGSLQRTMHIDLKEAAT